MIDAKDAEQTQCMILDAKKTRSGGRYFWRESSRSRSEPQNNPSTLFFFCPSLFSFWLLSVTDRRYEEG
jgi:hypothetical protein